MMGVKVSRYYGGLVLGRGEDFAEVNICGWRSVEGVYMKGGIFEDDFDGYDVHVVATVRGVSYAAGRDPMSHEDACSLGGPSDPRDAVGVEAPEFERFGSGGEGFLKQEDVDCFPVCCFTKEVELVSCPLDVPLDDAQGVDGGRVVSLGVLCGSSAVTGEVVASDASSSMVVSAGEGLLCRAGRSLPGAV